MCLVKRSDDSQKYKYSCRFSIVKKGEVLLTKEFPLRELSANEKIGKGYGFIHFLSHRNLCQRFEKFVANKQLEIRAEIVLTTESDKNWTGNESEVYLRTTL